MKHLLEEVCLYFTNISLLIMVAGTLMSMCCYDRMEDIESKRRSKEIDAQLLKDRQVGNEYYDSKTFLIN